MNIKNNIIFGALLAACVAVTFLASARILNVGILIFAVYIVIVFLMWVLLSGNMMGYQYRKYYRAPSGPVLRNFNRYLKQTPFAVQFLGREKLQQHYRDEEANEKIPYTERRKLFEYITKHDMPAVPPVERKTSTHHGGGNKERRRYRNKKKKHQRQRN